MSRSALASLAMVSLALVAIPCSAQQPSPVTAAMAPAPPGTVQQQDCPKVIGEISSATSVRFDPAAANARQVAADAARLQTEGRYTECYAAAQPVRDLLIASGPAAAVYPDFYDNRAWAHPEEDTAWVRIPQRP
ncbi:MAG TPA: hypothetical protein VIF11_06130 [Methylomirabilota bacterium]|jgi:hypothetical protein